MKAESLSITLLRRREETEAEFRPIDLGLFKRLFAYTRPYAGLRNKLFCAVVLRSLQLPALGAASGFIINRLIVSGDPLRLARDTACFFALSAFTMLVFFHRQKWALDLGEYVIHDLRNEIFTHLQRMQMSFFDRTKLGSLISRMTTDTEALRQGVQNILFVGIVGLGQMVFSAAVMLWIDPWLFAVVLGISPVLWWLNRHFKQRIMNALRNTHESFSRVTATLAESVAGIKVTQGCGRQDLNGRLFADLINDHSQYNVAAGRAMSLFVPLLDLNNQVFLALLLIVGGWRAASGAVAIGDIVMFFFLAEVFFAPVVNLGNIYQQALSAMAGAERVFHFLDTRPHWEEAPGAVAIDRIQGSVAFEDVSFAYKEDHLVLRGVSFKVEPGQTVALVGPTGGGKTTLMNLLAKFYLPGSGRILIDGYDLRDIQSSSLHRQLGIVLQNNFLFSGTVLDNIRFAKPEAGESEVAAAAARIGCLDLIEALPQGFHTTVGERGGTLSLGQRQIICFVRAMLVDPRILILDEATSSVDTITEMRLQQALRLLLKDRTSFVVAHRLNTVRGADRILVVESGSIAESGSHEQLIARGGLYASLHRQFTSQI